MDGERVLWSAPVGTGTGLRLESESGNWEFSSPTGTSRAVQGAGPRLDPARLVLRREQPPRSRRRLAAARRPGGLGVAAVYLGDEIAIHGTDRPELLGQRVSPRLHPPLQRERAPPLPQRAGGDAGDRRRQEVLGEQPDSVPPSPAPRAASPGADPLARVATAELLTRLDRSCRRPTRRPRGCGRPHARRARGARRRRRAARAADARRHAPRPGARPEYATFLADAFSRGSLRVVVSLNRIDEGARERAAAAIVRATMELWHGPLDERLTPWPTRRVPRLSGWGPRGRPGWQAMREAEGPTARRRARAQRG
jgi:hypothetical protein